MSRRAIERTVPTGALFAALTLIGIALSPFLNATGLLGSCAFQARLAMPCPTCHTTRAFAALAHADVPGAFAIQPLFTAGALLLIVWGIADLVQWRAGRESPLANLIARHRRIMAILIPCAITANWVYLASR
ncbi:MAG: DUF2752 domain-containing protein [Gemmatimonadetes bacterium]|nr:DUF2752 domain-containing protein [Gemmatimonadota bacterium]